ncbi:MAG: hypothetical protein LBM96_09175 [Methanobrevibacter sp.]|jgi:uncharacterized protein YeaO (DUF488 family)|nr:hypothetical protein [Candidatus Methanoflexus mossambicus]
MNPIIKEADKIALKTFKNPAEELAYWFAEQREKSYQAEKNHYKNELTAKNEELEMKDKEFKSKINQIAINLKKQNMPLDLISKTTGLTINEIKNLK